jgi:hypothetical protein
MHRPACALVVGTGALVAAVALLAILAGGPAAAQQTVAGTTSPPPCTFWVSESVTRPLGESRKREAAGQYASALVSRDAVERAVVRDACYPHQAQLDEIRNQNLIDEGVDAYRAAQPRTAARLWKKALSLITWTPTGSRAFEEGRFREGFSAYCEHLCDPDNSPLNPAFQDEGLAKTLSDAIHAGAKGDFETAATILRAANMKLQNHHPLFPAGYYMLGAAEWAQESRELACADWIEGIQAWTPTPPDFLAYYEEFNVSAIQLAMKYCVPPATESHQAN